MRKALHIINGDLYAGAERVQDLLALNLPRFNYEVGLVTLKDGLYRAARRATEAPLFPFCMRNRVDLRVVPGIAKIARSGGYQLMHTHSPRGALIGGLASAMAGVPLVHHLHGPTTHDTENVLRNYRNSLMERMCIRKVAHAVAVSRSVAGYGRSLGLPDRKCTVVWNGVEPVPEKRRAGDAHQTTLGAVALFRPRKGVEVLIEAAARLAEVRATPFRLLMVGGFESRAYEDLIKGLARRRGIEERIEWTGFTTDVQQMMRRMDVFVLPSLYGEGMPMVVLEAMALGLITVATSVGGIVEAIKDRRHGMLVPPGDAAALCQALQEILDDPSLRRQIGDSARRRQLECFSVDSMVAGVAGVYDQVLAAG